MSGSIANWALSGLAILIIGAALGPRIASAGPTFFLQILTYGFSDGAIYALVAIGYTMVYGIIELINFAHGDVFTLGAAVSIPVGFTTFPGEIWRTPRSWVEASYPNVIYFHKVDKGGHFAAWEEPELFSSELRAAFSSLR